MSISIRENDIRRYGNPVSAARSYVPTKIEAEGPAIASPWRHYELRADSGKTYCSDGTSDSRMMGFTKSRRRTSEV
jgi:hypothetical protein